MRVFLTKPELATPAGQELLELSVSVASDGRLDLDEIKQLIRWLRTNRANNHIAAIPYLQDIMRRIAADGVIDREERLELHLAIERVIPTARRALVIQARKKREQARRERLREKQRLEKERELGERKRAREEAATRSRRLRHSYSKVAGVSFPNDDGSERQEIIKSCRRGERLVLRHDAYNEYSMFATQVLRENGEQLGHAPEYLAERICGEIEDGYRVFGILLNVTGGTWTKPTRGVNFAAVYVSPDVSAPELHHYMRALLADRT